jgi:sialate O-acetylesterase
MVPTGRRTSRLLAFAIVATVFASRAVIAAELKLASPFSDHMVLEREQPVPFWGKADPGTAVTVTFAGQTRTATAGPDGRWRITLDPLAAASEGRSLVISTGTGTPAAELRDVLVGEVWLCSGQSNMDFTVAKTEKYYYAGVINESEEVAAANHPKIRMFTGEWTRAYQPQESVAGQWKTCTPENVREFSAIGYFFARELQKELNLPVGILTLTYGASTAQAWIRREAIAANPRLKTMLDVFDEQVKRYVPPNEQEMNAWREAAEKARAAGKRPPRSPAARDPVQDQHNPTVMYNGMIAPVVPYAIRGVLWYQGESITSPRALFPLLNETLIKDWRHLWDSELPFYFCQLAAYPNNSNGPEVRAWQAEALRLPGTAMAVTIDIGDRKDVHPHNKQDVGNRLARIALALVYDRKQEYSGPVYESMQVEGNALRLKFSHQGGGLVAKGGPLRTFEVAGSDGRYVPAEATIDGDTVVVSSPDVSAPVTARYAWSAYPEGCNLFNDAGLPAPPFQTEPPKR